MRIRDESKQEAIIDATVKLVNEIGFVASSVSKIAKKAGVSPATLYIYYENKEDLLVSTYVDIKKKVSQGVLKDFEPTLPIRDILKKFWLNTFDYISHHSEYFQFTEQFANSPYSTLVIKEEVEKQFQPMMQVLQRGIEQKIIKDVSFEILSAFVFYPITILSNSRLCQDFQITRENIDTTFGMAWDAIKL